MAEVVDACYKVYREFGRFFMEHAYEVALAYELRKRGHKVDSQRWIDVPYYGEVIERAFRADLVVDDILIIELKATDEINERFHAQIQTYMKFARFPLGILVNFHGELLKNNLFRKSLSEIEKYEASRQQRLRPLVNSCKS